LFFYEVVVDIDEVGDTDVQVLLFEIEGVKEQVFQKKVFQGLDLDAEKLT